MRKLFLYSSCLVVGVIGGIFGSLSVSWIHPPNSTLAHQIIMAHKIELMDSQNRVKAVFAAEDDGSVYLKMLSGNTSLIDLGIKRITPSVQGQEEFSSGQFTLRDSYGIPVIDMREINKGDGQISFSNAATRDQVILGYDNSECVVDKDDRGTWGVRVKGDNHSVEAMGVFTINGIPQKHPYQLEQPQKIRK